jgi:hypothetical protein
MQGNFMSTASGFVASALILLAVAVALALAQSSIELDHITVVVSPNAPERAARFHHSIGVHRVTSICLVSPKTYQPIEPLTYLEKRGVLIGEARRWLACGADVR